MLYEVITLLAQAAPDGVLVEPLRHPRYDEQRQAVRSSGCRDVLDFRVPVQDGLDLRREDDLPFDPA